MQKFGQLEKIGVQAFLTCNLTEDVYLNLIASDSGVNDWSFVERPYLMIGLKLMYF